jgi:BrnA antitoxin of type II toxin-antitoxin system
MYVMANRKAAHSPQSAGKETTHSVTIRLPADVLSHFKASGPGYQTRIREVLESHIERERRLESFEHVCAKLKRVSLGDKRVRAALQSRPLNLGTMRDPFDALPD